MKQTFNLLCLLAVWLFSASVLNAQTPVAYYTFSGNAKDQSSFGNNASVNGATLTQDRFGWSNSALFFDGVQSGVRANNAAQLSSPLATVSFWINVKSFPAQGEVYLISNGGWQERFKVSMPNHGKPVFTTNASSGISDMDSGTPLTLNTWTQVVLVHDGAKDIIYFNGVKVNEKAVTGNLNSTSKPLGIGYDAIDNANYFNGAMDDVAFFDVALNATQIAAWYAAQSIAPVIPQGKVADYTFSQNSLDATIYGNHADISTAALGTDRFGFGKSALLLDGATSEVTAANAAQLNGANTTITFWVKVNSLPANGEAFLLSNGGWQERFKISLPSHGKVVFTTNGSGGISDMDAGNGNELPVGVWKQVVMVHNGVADKIFIDGVLKGSKAVTGSLNPSTKPLGIGYNPIDGGNWFDGAMDDVSIYNYALSDAEIGTLFALESLFPGTSTDLVANYSLNGNGKDATLFQNDASLDAGASATTNRHGWGANALSGYATADNSIALQSDNTTISFWAKPNSLPGTGEVYLLSNGGYQERWKISLPPHGKPVFTTYATTCCSDMDSGNGNELVVGQWKHVVMTHDGVNDKIYINGVLVNTKASAGPLHKTKYPLGIGYDPIDQASFFDGNLDDIQIYNRALSAVEITALYTAQNAAPVVAGNLVANYPFSGDGADVTPYANAASGVILATDRFGKSNKAAAFNGTTTNVTAANSPQLNSPVTSVGFWVKVNAFAANGESFLMSFGGWQERWKISLPSHGKIVWTTNHTNGISDMDAGGGNELPVGAWRHVVLVHDGAKDIIYINGVQVAEKAVVGTLNNTTKPLGIGYNAVDGGNVFDGLIDEVQIYNVALTAQQIAALYAAQNTPPASTDTEAPNAPLNLSADVVFTDVQLNWLPATDNVGVTAYNVYQNSTVVATTPATGLAISGLTPLTDYVFGVSAVDAEGNESTITTLKVTSGQDQTPDTTPPTSPGNLAGTAASNSVLITWEASTDDRQVAGYVISVDGTVVDTVSATTLSSFISGLDALTLYTFEVYAFDPAGNNSVIAELTLSTTAPINTGEAGMVAYYPFDGNADDATPYKNHGVIGGNPTFEVPTHPNGGSGNIKFDGVQDSVLAPNAAQLVSDYATVSFWIRVDDQNLAVAESYIMDFGHWSSRWKISLPQHLKIVWTTNGNNTQFTNFISDMDSGDGNEMVKGFWWFVTMVHDGAKDLIYVNGQLVNSKPVATKLNSTALPLGFGNNPVDGGQYFIGALDEVKIYNKALTDAEILKLYSSGTTAIKDQLQNDLRNVVLNMSPNPVSNVLTIQHNFPNNQPLLVRVFDAEGRQVDAVQFGKDKIPAGQFSLQVGQYPTGIYTVNFVLGGKNLGALQVTKQ